MALTAQQLRQFSNECLALRRLLETGSDVSEAERDLLRSQVLALQAELDGCNAAMAAGRTPTTDLSSACVPRGGQPC